uniref:Uncharacterized protein n=1 Tax=Glossina brevipalpis TaxID=37001 RepID=A0A1A9W5Q8_9MUSC
MSQHCKHLNLDLNVEVDVLTSDALAEVINSILESLLYQRNQIPFVYKTYRHYVQNWSKEENDDEDLLLQRQKENATMTKNSISAMKELIRSTFKNKLIKSLRFLFGSTTYTPKEAYTIHLPIETISNDHFHKQHLLPTVNLNQTLLSFLTHPDLHTIFSSNLNPTNIYLEIEISKQKTTQLKTTSNTKFDMIPKESHKLPPSCKDVNIHLIHNGKENVTSLRCCKNLLVYKDFVDLNLENNAVDSVPDNCKTILYEMTEWWEAHTYIRGFKEQRIKYLNLWS